MSVLKIQNVGEIATLEVSRCELVEGQYGEQVLFSDGEDDLYLPRATADRQLERVGLLPYKEAVGTRLKFSRSPNPKGKPYWNVELLGKANGRPIPKSLDPQTVEREESEELAEKIGPADGDTRKLFASAQKQAVEYVIRDIVPQFTKIDIGMTDDVVHKFAFELYKTWVDKGLVG